jgi:hypothetical protein
MARTPYRQSVERLSDEDRAKLLRTFKAHESNPDLAFKVTRLIFSCGAHPAVLSDPAKWDFRISDDGRMWTWHRPKTDLEINAPADVSLVWLPEFIEELKRERYNTVYLNHLVHRFGARAGLPGITPRTLRHDYSYRALESQGLLAARALTGTTTRTLLGYTGSKVSKQAALRAAADPKGLFG